MRPDQCIFFLLTRTAQDGTSRLAKALEPYKITPAQAIVLAFLSEEEDFRIFNELAFEMRIDSATMSGIVNRLKSARLVVRVRNPLDRRSVMIRLTKKGKEVAQKIKTVISNSDRSFLSRMDKTDRENLRSILIRMYNTR